MLHFNSYTLGCLVDNFHEMIWVFYGRLWKSSTVETGLIEALRYLKPFPLMNLGPHLYQPALHLVAGAEGPTNLLTLPQGVIGLPPQEHVHARTLVLHWPIQLQVSAYRHCNRLKLWPHILQRWLK